MASLNAEIRDKDAQLARLTADKKRLQKLVSALHEALSDIPAHQGSDQPFRQLRGKLPWPVRGRLAVAYGSPRDVGRLRWQLPLQIFLRET